MTTTTMTTTTTATAFRWATRPRNAPMALYLRAEDAAWAASRASHESDEYGSPGSVKANARRADNAGDAAWASVMGVSVAEAALRRKAYMASPAARRL